MIVNLVIPFGRSRLIVCASTGGGNDLSISGVSPFGCGGRVISVGLSERGMNGAVFGVWVGSLRCKIWC